MKRATEHEDIGPDHSVSSRILEKLRDYVVGKGSKLLIVFIPSKREVEELDDSVPYQTEIIKLCQHLGIEHLDLGPTFKSTWFRTYYRKGGHWNSRGHELAARVLYDYLKRDQETRGRPEIETGLPN